MFTGDLQFMLVRVNELKSSFDVEQPYSPGVVLICIRVGIQVITYTEMKRIIISLCEDLNTRGINMLTSMLKGILNKWYQ